MEKELSVTLSDVVGSMVTGASVEGILDRFVRQR
jgi:hypothetical protein